MPRPSRTFDRLVGKAAIVTGAGSPEGGIGRTIALLLAAEGAAVSVVDVDAPRAEATAREIAEAGGSAHVLIGDISDPEVCRQIVADSAAAAGGVDILVNNVGISSSNPLVNVDFAAWSRVFDINLKTAVAMSSFAVPEMQARGGGAIVNIASIAGISGYGGSVAYGPSKAAMIALTRDIAAMHGRDGIRANAVAPGHVYTPHIGHMFSDAMRAARRRVAPLGVEGDAWDVAEAVLFLVSDAARFITGVLLPVDGGVTAIGPMAGHAFISRGD